MSVATFYARRLLASSRNFSVQSLLQHRAPVLAANNSSIKLPSLVVATDTRRCFQTTTPKLINPLLIAFIKPFSRVFAMVVGRRFRRWWRTLPESEKIKFRNEIKKRSRVWIGLGVAALAGIAYAYESHVEESPITKRRRFVALNRDQVDKIATSEFQQLSEEFSGLMLPESSHYYSRMTRVASRILRSNSDLKEISGKNWTVTVIDRGDKNAFVLPTGNIFVFSGMLDLCANDDQLGIIISHEIAHTVLNHAGEHLSHVNFVSALLMVPLAVLWAFIPSDGIAVIADWFIHKASSMIFELPYSRDMEMEADEVGLLLAAKACFDVREAPAFWALMELSEAEEEKMPFEILSTHPTHQNREGNLASLVPKAIEVRSSCGCHRLGPTDPYAEFKKYVQKVAQRKEAAVNQSSPVVPIFVK